MIVVRVSERPATSAAATSPTFNLAIGSAQRGAPPDQEHERPCWACYATSHGCRNKIASGRRRSVSPGDPAAPAGSRPAATSPAHVGRFRAPGRRERTVLPDHVPPTRRALRRPTRYLIRYVLAPEGLTRTPSPLKSVSCAIWRAVPPFIASTACLVIWTLSDFCWARSFRPFGHDGVAGLLFDRRKPAISTAPLPSRRTAGGAGIGAGDWTDRAEMP